MAATEEGLAIADPPPGDIIETSGHCVEDKIEVCLSGTIGYTQMQGPCAAGADVTSPLRSATATTPDRCATSRISPAARMALVPTLPMKSPHRVNASAYTAEAVNEPPPLGVRPLD